jgi:hypothetical protein
VKRPAFQFYPADWRKDAALQSCSIGARGLWHELLCVMHECQPYGHLSINGNALNEDQAARIVGVPFSEYRRLMAELERAGVPSRSSSGELLSRRMVKDERVRTIRAEAGKQGGNPFLLGNKDKQKAASKDNQTGKQIPTPSASALPSGLSSASAFLETGAHAPKPPKKNGVHNLGTRLPDDWRLPEEWKVWAMEIRPDWSPQGVVRESISFRDYWIAAAGTKGVKRNWLATWRTWIRRAEKEPTI